MDVISKLGLFLFVLSLFASQLNANEPQSWAGLRIANALDEGSVKLQVDLDGRAWTEEGMGSGEVSGLRRVSPGTHRLEFSLDGLGERQVRLTLKPGQIYTLVPHIRIPADGSEREIRVLKLAHQKPRSGRLATVIDLGSKPRRLLEIKQVGKSWAPLALRRMELQRFRITQHRGYLPMRVGQQRLSSLPVFEEGHQVLVLFERKGGELASLYFRDRAWPTAGASSH